MCSGKVHLEKTQSIRGYELKVQSFHIYPSNKMSDDYINDFESKLSHLFYQSLGIETAFWIEPKLSVSPFLSIWIKFLVFQQKKL